MKDQNGMLKRFLLTLILIPLFALGRIGAYTKSPGKFSDKTSATPALKGFFFPSFSVTKGSYKLARLKYNGGGDWYGDRTALTNLANFCNRELQTDFDPAEATVEPQSPDIYNYPYIFVTGHGNVTFSDPEAKNLRTYLIGGGFLHICDNYGFNKFIRVQMKKVFPELEFVELPYTHPVFHQKYSFPGGLPKIHEHDGKRPQAFGLIYKGRLVCFYDYEADLGNGWEDIGTYPDDPPAKHQQALQMGANLISYAFMQ